MNRHLRFEVASPEDLPGVLAVEGGAYIDPWPEEAFLGEVDNTCSTLLVAKDADGAIVGHMVYWELPGEVQLQNIGVHPDARRRGIGRKLMTYLIDEARRAKAEMIHMEVRTSNVPAITLYRSLGFDEMGVRKGYYRVGSEDALLMSLSLNQGSA